VEASGTFQKTAISFLKWIEKIRTHLGCVRVEFDFPDYQLIMTEEEIILKGNEIYWNSKISEVEKKTTDEVAEILVTLQGT
jgi:hypothetical protein